MLKHIVLEHNQQMTASREISNGLAIRHMIKLLMCRGHVALCLATWQSSCRGGLTKVGIHTDHWIDNQHHRMLWLQGYVALCLAAHDVAEQLPEWLNWHHLAGVDRFYVFDLGSSPPMNQVWFNKGQIRCNSDPLS